MKGISRGLLVLALIPGPFLPGILGEAQGGTPQAASPLKGDDWEFVGGMGAIRTLYVAPSRLEDREFLARVIAQLLDGWGRERPIQIDIFDDRALTPKTLPYSPESRARMRAKFNFNPANGLKRFVRILPPAPGDPSGKRRQVEDPLPLP